MIYVECKPDTVLVQALTSLPAREIVHELKGKYEVLKRISAGSNTLGMVDEDPQANQPAYLSRMGIIQDMPQRGLKVLEDPSKGNRVVLLCPKLEDWVLRTARDARIDLGNPTYNLPTSPTRLHREITIDLRKFERLVQDLKNTPRFRSLRTLLA